MFGVAEALGGKFSTLRTGSGDAGRFEARDLVLGLSEHAAAGVEHYLCVAPDDMLRGRLQGVQGIVDEVTARGSETDQECLHYVMHEEAGSNIRRFQGGLMRDCDEHGVLLPSRRTAQGRGMRLADFLADPNARNAGLEEAHVVALRLYTTAAFRTINSELRNQVRFGRGEAHPLPLTVAWIRDALSKLRQIEAKSARATQVVYLYRGMAGVRIQPEFLAKGGTELAPMSTTSSLKVAMEYSAGEKALLLRIKTKNFMTRGPSISFLSAFPLEQEFLYPPLTYLHPTGDEQRLRVDDATFTVIDVEPTFP